METRNFVDETGKMLGTHLVKGAAVNTFQYGPKGLNAVRVCLAIHIFLDGMVDGF